MTPLRPDEARESQDQALVPVMSSITPAPAYASQPRLGAEPGASVNLARYLAALKRYRWLVVGTTLLGVAGGVAATRIVKPEFQAQATIWIEGGSSRVSGSASQDRGPIRASQLLETDGWVDLLKSYVVMDHAASTLRLFLHRAPEDSALFTSFGLKERIRPGAYRLVVSGDGKLLGLQTQEGLQVEQVAAGDSVGRQLGFAWQPTGPFVPGKRVDFSVATPREAAVQLATSLRVASDRDGNFMRVELAGTDRRLVAATINAITRRFVDVAAELKREKLTELARILGEQLRRTEQNLRESESALQTFRVNTITLPSERSVPLSAGLQVTQDPVFESFFAMRVELEQVRRDRDAIQRGLATVADTALSTDALEVIGSVQRSSELTRALAELTEKRAELRAFRYRYTDEHPPVQRLMVDIAALQRTTIPAITQVLQDELAAREAELERRIGSASRELQQIPPRAIQEARLQRDVEIADNLYTTLQGRYEEARLAEASTIPDVRILDAAVVPERPSRNRAMQLLLFGLVGGIGLGVVAAILLDRFDRRLQYPEQVTSDMGLMILGVVPHLKGAQNGTHAADTVQVVEALRGIRMNLVHAYGAAGPLIVTVTSPGSGDGKSFLSANLALSFANAGHRVLLIDGDSRRGTLHRVLKLRRTPGLTDYLAGRIARAELVSETSTASLHFIGCGTRLKDAPELLGSPMMSQLMTSLRSSYSVIIVDSPPLGAGVDAYALATWTGNLVLVLRTGATDRQFAEAKLEVLDRLPIRVLGAVLNGVREWNVYRYYSYYLPGYEHEEDVGAGKKAVGITKL